MQFKRVNYLKLRDYVSSAWRYDKDLIKFYDKSVSVSGNESMVLDTVQKITEMYRGYEDTEIYGIDIDSGCAGFIVLVPSLNLLYSFGLNVNHRKGEYLEYMFKFICSKLKNGFSCILYDYNTRAINWLKRCGMKEVEDEKYPGSVFLKFELCQ